MGIAMMGMLVATGGLLMSSLAGCASRIDPELVSDVRKTDWYHNAAKEARSHQAFWPLRVLGYNSAVVIGTVYTDAVCPAHDGGIWYFNLFPFETLYSTFSIREDRLHLAVTGKDIPPSGAFRRGSIWAFYISANNAGEWGTLDAMLVREAPPDTRLTPGVNQGQIEAPG